MLRRTSQVIAVLIIQGCANTTNYDANEVHSACYLYMYGERGFERDYSKALEWCQKSSDLDVSSGHTLLAEMYFFGYGVEPDPVKAASIYEKAALQDHPHAQLMVFQIYNVYLASESSPEQKANGLTQLKRAVDSGYPKAIEVHNLLFGQEI